MSRTRFQSVHPVDQWLRFSMMSLVYSCPRSQEPRRTYNHHRCHHPQQKTPNTRLARSGNRCHLFSFIRLSPSAAPMGRNQCRPRWRGWTCPDTIKYFQYWNLNINTINSIKLQIGNKDLQGETLFDSYSKLHLCVFVFPTISWTLSSVPGSPRKSVYLVFKIRWPVVIQLVTMIMMFWDDNAAA